MANIWREPVFDRTLSDVSFAIQQIAAWKQSHTHSADVKVETNAIVINVDGDTSVDQDNLFLQANGNVRVENDVVILELGVVHDLKGCLNLTDIVRIEDNISYIAEYLKQYRYPVVVDCKDWVQSDLPNADDMKRIVKNIRDICSGFVTPSGLLTMPETILTYQDINALEYNLHSLKQLLDVMQGLFIKSGTHKCGATIKLPTRR